MNVLVGTSGYAYKEWKGVFYPVSTKPDQMLGYYGTRFPTVEINNTFYRMPRESVLETWASQVPDTFRFVLKASRRITHLQRLKDVDGPLSYLINAATVLGSRLGPLLFQLPPNMKKDLSRLEVFLSLLPEGRRAAVEFRDESWFEDDVYDALHSCNAALCVADTDEKPGQIVATADWGYLRLRRAAYDDASLTTWAQSVGRQPWRDAFVFFKHEEKGTAPEQALSFIELLPE
ncbi:MAG: DUF72 domain-containing protein [Gemmatimonadales bacterium]